MSPDFASPTTQDLVQGLTRRRFLQGTIAGVVALAMATATRGTVAAAPPQPPLKWFAYWASAHFKWQMSLDRMADECNLFLVTTGNLSERAAPSADVAVLREIRRLQIERKREFGAMLHIHQHLWEEYVLPPHADRDPNKVFKGVSLRLGWQENLRALARAISAENLQGFVKLLYPQDEPLLNLRTKAEVDAMIDSLNQVAKLVRQERLFSSAKFAVINDVPSVGRAFFRLPEYDYFGLDYPKPAFTPGQLIFPEIDVIHQALNTLVGKMPSSAGLLYVPQGSIASIDDRLARMRYLEQEMHLLLHTPEFAKRLAGLFAFMYPSANGSLGIGSTPYLLQRYQQLGYGLLNLRTPQRFPVALWSSSVHPTTAEGGVADGSLDTAWNSGGPAPAWLEADLLRNAPLRRVVLIPDMFPNGNVTIEVRGGTEMNPGTMIGRYSGYAEPSRPITITTTGAQVRFCRVTFVQSPSWIALKSAEYFAS